VAAAELLKRRRRIADGHAVSKAELQAVFGLLVEDEIVENPCLIGLHERNAINESAHFLKLQRLLLVLAGTGVGDVLITK
jgi:hypothetical protein